MVVEHQAAGRADGDDSEKRHRVAWASPSLVTFTTRKGREQRAVLAQTPSMDGLSAVVSSVIAKRYGTLYSL